MVGFAACFVSYLALVLTIDLWPHEIVWIVGVFAMNFSIQDVFVAFIALHMSICWKKVAATQFAVYMAWSNLCRSFGVQAYGEMSPYLEAVQEMLIMAGLSASGAVLLIFVRLERHGQRLATLSPPKLTDVPARF